MKRIKMIRGAMLQGAPVKPGAVLDITKLGEPMAAQLVHDGKAEWIKEEPKRQPSQAEEQGEELNREALLEKAKVLGLNPHPNTGAEKLARMVNEHQAQAEEPGEKQE